MSSITPAASQRDALPNVLVIGTFDTKSDELGALILLDTSARYAERPAPAVLAGRRFIDQDAVAGAAETTCAAVSALPRGEAVSVLRRGVRVLLQEMLDAGEIDGAICMGGAGTHIAGPGLQELPLGFPKLIVSHSTRMWASAMSQFCIRWPTSSG
jgi:uncharacterized protein (UPF0261 family)